MFHARGRKYSALLLASALVIASMVPVSAAPAVGDLVVNGVNIPGLTALQCMATDVNNNVVSAGFACGSGSGTVTAVTGSGNILSSGGTTPNITTVNSPTFSGTVTVGQVINNGLTVSQCAASNASKQMISSGELCPTTYISGVRAGGLHVETGQKVVSATTPWQATLTFGLSYTVAPFCTTNILNATPLFSGAAIVSESTTAVTIYDSSNQGYTYNIICIGY